MPAALPLSSCQNVPSLSERPSCRATRLAVTSLLSDNFSHDNVFSFSHTCYPRLSTGSSEAGMFLRLSPFLQGRSLVSKNVPSLSVHLSLLSLFRFAQSDSCAILYKEHFLHFLTMEHYSLPRVTLGRVVYLSQA